MNQSQPPALNIDLSSATDIKCDSCGNYTFEQVMLMKKVSALVSPTGKEGIIPIPVFACAACGYINDGFFPTVTMAEESRGARNDIKLVEV